MSNSFPYSSVCPYLMIPEVEKQVSFLEKVFDGKVKESKTNENGQLQHAEIIIGDVVIMMGRARKIWPARQSMNYVFVANVDAVYEKAMALGAKSIAKPVKQGYGIYEGGVEDEFGNQWWIGSEY